MVKNGASSHETNYINNFPEILNLGGHKNRCIGSKVTAILLNRWSCIGKGLRLQPAQQACFFTRPSSLVKGMDIRLP